MGTRRGRPILGAIMGLLFGLFLGFDLALMGVVPLESVLLVVLPLLGLALGIALGMTAPLRMFGR
ncbi:MAG: hypothetical protein R3C39_11895 [Dehalococcoidia bacterium]